MMKLFSIVLGLMLFSFATLQAQVTLTGTSYTENFDGIGTGYPTGWTTYKNATSSSIGTAALTLTTAATSWKTTTGGSCNYASADGLTIADSANVTTQTASTDRALGYKQTGPNGDPGASFVFQIANTTGMTSFNLSFKLQSLAPAVTRVALWKVQYATGTTPTLFTDVTTNHDSLYTGNGTWLSTDVAVNFGSALDNQAGPVWIRIVSLTGTTGSGSRPSTAIDDVNLTWSTATLSSDATLSNLTTGGATVAGFSTSTLSYNVVLPFGTTVVPTVTATTNNTNATYVITPAAAIPGASTVLVTAQNGSTQLTYTINYTVAATASTDASLSDLKVNGTSVAGFASTTYTYNIALPYGTVTVPTVLGIASDANATVSYVPAAALPGVDSVKVTAQDGTTKLLYLVNFTITPAATDASLSDLKINGTTLTGFAPTTYSYNVTLPYGTVTVPTVIGVATDANAIVSYVHAAALPGVDSVKVTAQDGTTKLLYLVNFTITPAATDATLSNLTSGGTTVTGFNATTYSYNVVLPAGTTVVPTATATTTDVNATYVITAATSLPGATTVVVTAQDGSTQQTYTINYTVAIQTYTVTFNVVGTNGALAATVDAAAITSPATVNAGKNVIFTATPVANYSVKEWKLDGTIVAGNTTNTYTLSNLAANSTVTVEFKLNVGVNEATQNVVSIYPNPANNVVNVKMNNTINKIAVVNMNGQVVTESEINNLEGSINTSSIANGMYFLRIETATGITMNKIQIVK